VTVEEAQETPDVVIGMFLVNDTSAVVLFDSGASYSFISTTYVCAWEDQSCGCGRSARNS
jgi:hypothetical protein